MRALLAQLRWSLWLPLVGAGRRWPWVLAYWLGRLLRSRRLVCRAWRGLLADDLPPGC